MGLPIDVIRKMLGEAFDCGYSGCKDLRDEYISEILEKNQNDLVGSVAEDFRLWTAEELKALPKGVEFTHKTLGKCTTTEKQNVRYMTFENKGLAPAGFNSNGYPWDIPLKRVS